MRYFNNIISTITFILIFVVGPAIFAGTTNAGPVQIYRTGWVPFEGVGLNNCNGEDYSFTGKHFSQMQVTEDSSGGLHIVVLERLRGTAVDLVTGSKYVSMEGGTYTETDTTAGVVNFTLPFTGTVISLNKDVPDLHYSFRLHLTINSNGNLTSSTNTFEIFCR